MDMSASLQANNEQLYALWSENSGLVVSLQMTLLDQILPNVVDELEIDPEDVKGAREWLQDVGSVFRMLKRHKFTSAFALETMRTTILWRLTNIPRQPPTSRPSDLIYCLAPPTSDTFGRPVLILRLASLNDSSDSTKGYLIYVIETLRGHLQDINSEMRTGEKRLILQYTLIVDMQDVSMRNINLDLLKWYIREIVPRFPGMLAAVFVINFSWTHASLWNLVKRILPEPALSKVLFPTMKGLHDVVPTSSLPQEYGGQLPKLKDVTNIVTIPDESSSPSLDGRTVSHTDAHRPSPPPNFAAAPRISPRSRYNPFFGYPISPHAPASGSSIPHLHHGRRRKRDLARTLTILWWKRWKTPLVFGLCLFLALCCVGARSQRWHWARFLTHPVFVRSHQLMIRLAKA